MKKNKVFAVLIACCIFFTIGCGDSVREENLKLWSCILEKSGGDPPLDVLISLLQTDGIQEEIENATVKKLEKMRIDKSPPTIEQLEAIIECTRRVSLPGKRRALGLREMAGEMILNHPKITIKAALFVKKEIPSLEKQALRKCVTLPNYQHIVEGMRGYPSGW